MGATLKDADKVVTRELAKWTGTEIVSKDVTGTGHRRFRVKINGVERIFIVSGSASDHRAMENNRALVARTCKALKAVPVIEAKRAANKLDLKEHTRPADYALLSVRAMKELQCDTRDPHWELQTEDGAYLARAQTYEDLLLCLPKDLTEIVYLVPVQLGSHHG